MSLRGPRLRRLWLRSTPRSALISSAVIRGCSFAVGFLLICSACVAPDRVAPGVLSSMPPSPAASPASTGSPAPSEVEPLGPIPAVAPALADHLKRVDHLLRAHVLRFRAQGREHAPALVRRLQTEGLRQQQIYRYLASHPVVAGRVYSMVAGEIRHEMAANLGAATDLSSLVAPVEKIPKYRFAHPLPPDKLRKVYGEAQRRFGVPWYVLAAVNFVESKFGRILGPSSSGAVGPMQFLPSTFDAYGKGDINDPHDSIVAAARYLTASGAPEHMARALFAYNRAHAYVDAVLRYARHMHRYPWSFWAYYESQVFVSTTRGAVRLTGPGTAHPDQGRPAPT
jgi:soluble lytic murein transglycosylase-like protein